MNLSIKSNQYRGPGSNLSVSINGNNSTNGNNGTNNGINNGSNYSEMGSPVISPTLQNKVS